MRRARLIGVAVTAAVALILVATQPAGATISQTQAWHGGRSMSNNYGGPVSYGCTSGLTFVGVTYGRYYKAEPRHCYESNGWGNNPFFGVYEGDGTNYHDGGTWGISPQVYLPQAGSAYQYFDLAFVNLGTSAPARSKLTFNYCVGSDCSSNYGGGSANCNWCGSWFTNYGYLGNPQNNVQYTKSGMTSGTSWQTVAGAAPAAYTYNGNTFWVYNLTNFGQCGVTHGDSGAPVFWHQGGGLVYPVGMVIGGNATNIAGPGNGCYPSGTAFATNAYVISVAQMQAAFAHLDPGGVIPYF